MVIGFFFFFYQYFFEQYNVRNSELELVKIFDA